MDGINRKPGIDRTDNRNKYLKTLRYTPKGTVIDAVQAIRPAANQLNNQKPTFLFDIDVLNKHVTDLQDAYRNIRGREKKYKDLMRAYQADADSFLGLIKELVKQFNQTTASVLTFDRVFQTSHSEVLSDMLNRQQFVLETIGLRIVGLNQLEFNGQTFRWAARKQETFFSESFQPAITLFERAFTYIGRIRVP